jgi:nucleoside-diphosphate-sugar epimerase
MRVLVTGGAGYIGSVLLGRLLDHGHFVRVIDRLTYGGESLLGVFGHPNFELVKADLRDEERVLSSLERIECVVHLAAIVGEPLCAKMPDQARAINFEATRFLVDSCKKNGIQRFLFASTCSNYGARENEAYATEDTEVEAVSLYAETKISAERYILGARTDDFHPCVLRFATVYGLSPRMRFDLLVQEFVRDAVVHKKLAIYRPLFWRPLVHVRDVAEAVLTAVEAGFDKVSGKIYNVGGENFRKIEIGRLITALYPDISVLEVQGKEDPRNYRVSFELISSALGFQIKKDLRSGLLELKRAIDTGIISNPADAKYGNVYYDIEKLTESRGTNEVQLSGKPVSIQEAK